MSRVLNCMMDIFYVIFNNQKIVGLILIFCGVMSAVIDCEPGVHDASAFICVFLPMGLLFLFSKENLFNYQG